MTRLPIAPPLAQALALEPHPEGGWYRQTWASPEQVTLALVSCVVSPGFDFADFELA